MRAVGVVGPSDAGKTTLVERLVPRLAERGRVATVKAIHHDVELDEPGSDTHRHRTAGAEKVVGVTPSLTATFVPRGKADAPDEAAALRRLLADLADEGFDYVLVEGFAGSALPKLVVGTGADEVVGAAEGAGDVETADDEDGADRGGPDRDGAADEWRHVGGHVLRRVPAGGAVDVEPVVEAVDGVAAWREADGD